MIYLLRSFGENNQSILKVGYTDNSKRRFDSYFYHNPLSKILDTREGDEMHESLLHLYLNSLGYSFEIDGKLDKWYQDIPEVQEIFFKLPLEDLYGKVWESREKIYAPERLRQGNYVYQSFQYLFERGEEFRLCTERFEIKDDGRVIENPEYLEVDEVFLELYNKKDVPEVDLLKVYPEDLLSKAQDFLDNCFYSTGVFREKMRMYCEFLDTLEEDQRDNFQEIICIKIKNGRFRKYYNFYDTSGCKSVRYEEKLLLSRLVNMTKMLDLEKAIRSKFLVGEKYTLKSIKEELGIIYQELGITNRKPIATDLREYFKLVRVKFTDPQTKKRIEGFRLEPL